MKRNKLILGILILSIIVLVFSGCGTTPNITQNGSISGRITVPDNFKKSSESWTYPLTDASVDTIDSEGKKNITTTDNDGYYNIFDVAPGYNYIITAEGTKKGSTIIIKDVAEQVKEGENYSAGTADAESTTLALVLENLAENTEAEIENINLSDIKNCNGFEESVYVVSNSINAGNNVTTDPLVDTAIESVVIPLSIITPNPVDSSKGKLWGYLYTKATTDDGSDLGVPITDYKPVVGGYVFAIDSYANVIGWSQTFPAVDPYRTGWWMIENLPVGEKFILVGFHPSLTGHSAIDEYTITEPGYQMYNGNKEGELYIEIKTYSPSSGQSLAGIAIDLAKLNIPKVIVDIILLLMNEYEFSLYQHNNTFWAEIINNKLLTHINYFDNEEEKQKIIDVVSQLNSALEDLDFKKAKNCCLSNSAAYSEAYNQVIEIEEKCNELESLGNEISIGVEEPDFFDIEITIEGIVAKTSDSGSLTIFSTSPSGEQTLVDSSEKGKTFLEKTENGWKIYKSSLIENISVEDLNYPPEISSLTAFPSSVDINQTTTITCTASDEDVGGTLTYTWTKNIGSFEGSTSGPIITWRAPSTQGTYIVSCEVSDGEASDNEQVAITVNNPGTSYPVHNLTKDTYYTTIQAALNDADNDNTIEVADGTYDESIIFPSSKKIILQSANGASSTIIRGNDDLNVVVINNSPEGTTLEGFSITHADGLTGRGIYIHDGNLTINNCDISGNSTPWDGGGIYNGGTVTIIACNIHDNTASTTHGGGIYNHGTATITGSTICGNNSLYAGGGIFNYDFSNLTITGSLICLNTAASTLGGGICNYENSSLTITESNISGNSGNSGGGIQNSYNCTLNITGGTISANNASSHGGGISNAGTAIITGINISGNSGDYGGGIFNSGTLTITGSLITGNSGDYGGGIYYNTASEIIAIGGSNENDLSNFNEFTNNYKTGNAPSPDQHIRDPYGDCHMDYPYNNYYPDNANNIIDGQITDVSPLTNPFDLDAWYTANVYVKNTGNVSHTFTLRGLKPSGTDFEGGTEKPITIDPGQTKSVPFTYQFYGTETGRTLTFYLYDNSGNLLNTKQTESLLPISLDAVITNITDSVAGPLIDPFELNKWYTAKVYISVDYNGPDSGIIEVKPKPDSGIAYNPTVKEFPYDKNSLGGSRGFDYQFIGSGTTRELTFELYDQATGDELDEYTSETLQLMHPDPHLEYIESSPSSTNLQVLHWFNFNSDYVIKAYFDDGHIETWTNYSKFLFETSNEDVVYVGTEIGNMMGIGPGTATITVTYKEDTSKKAYLSVTVYQE